MGKGKECLAEESAGAVIEKYSNMVYRLAYARTGSRHDADDIYQEVFLRYFRRKPVFDSEEHRKAWLLRVTVNCSNSFLSAPWQRRTMGLPEDLPYEGGRKDHLDLHSKLQMLPAKYRGVIHLFYYEELSVEEIARILHRKPSTVRTQLVRARQRLARILKEEDYAF